MLLRKRLEYFLKSFLISLEHPSDRRGPQARLPPVQFLLASLRVQQDRCVNQVSGCLLRLQWVFVDSDSDKRFYELEALEITRAILVSKFSLLESVLDPIQRASLINNSELFAERFKYGPTDPWICFTLTCKQSERVQDRLKVLLQ
jgi:hypothetical protein